MKTVRSIFALALAVGTAGCSWFEKTDKMDAGRRFAPAQAGGGAAEPVAAGNGTDQGGYVAPPEAGRDLQDKAFPREEQTGADQGRSSAKPQAATGTRSAEKGGESAPVASAPRPRGVAHPTTNSTGTYMTLGGVVAEVNEHPIYATEVLREIIRPLAARAQELDEPAFRSAATTLIRDQLKALTRNETVFAAAQRNLDEKDKDTARRIAAHWRQQQITEVGGSLEQAKKKWASEGYDFEDRVEEEYRRMLTSLYYQKKVWPRVQVTANDMRRYYQQHLSEQFTEHEEVRFRVIKVDPKRTGSREKALEKIKDLYQRAARGEDFAELAGGTNDDAYLMKRQGDVGWVRKGDYKIDEIEKAVWGLQPGQVTDIVDAGGAFYIAKVEERKPGRVRVFDEQAVQEAIRENLRKEQFRVLSDKNIDDLNKNTVVRTNDAMINTAVDMAMQNYPLWRAGGKGGQPQTGVQ